MSSISSCARSSAGGGRLIGAVRARRGLQALELLDHLLRDGVELGARLELGLVVDDLRLELLVAERERDVGERHLRRGRHEAFRATASAR